ncbi:peptidoglycan-binding protein [Streptomyces sp. NBC_01190]|uniref:peptidoglycan-binding domain-containing protein n=1 Tax=Streptomyces sp. NBC_01190 TaxID=2903767 RepID=UPI00386B6BAD|nr:peptidoglycan-binding protein [Streptomyces sp. NBC_01190]
MALVSGSTMLGASLVLGGVVTATPASAANCLNYSGKEPTIGYGNAGPAVKRAQCELNSGLAYRGIYITVDGIFGNDTLNATAAFQACAGTTADGIIGPQTWSWLDAYYVAGHGAAC